MSKKEKKSKASGTSELQIGGLTYYCHEYFKVPLSKAIVYDKKLKKIYNSFRKRFIGKTNTEEIYIYLLKGSERKVLYYRMLWVTKEFSYTFREDVLDLDRWMKEMSQLSQSGEPIIAVINTSPYDKKILILELSPFDYRLADRIKSQAILEAI